MTNLSGNLSNPVLKHIRARRVATHWLFVACGWLVAEGFIGTVGVLATADAAESPAQAVQAPARTQAGNLVIEGIPPIPAEVNERIRRYQNVRGHRFSGWLAKGDGMLVATRFGQVVQLHHVRSPGAARRQLTFFREPVYGAVPAPAGDGFLFAKDVGGDEFYQAHYFALRGGEITQFTQPGTRNGSLVWNDAGTQAAWYRAQDGKADFDLLLGNPRDPASVRVLHEGEGALYPADFSPDGEWLLVERYISITHSRLYKLHLDSGEMVEVNPQDEVAYGGAELLADGSVLTTTDKDAEFKNLVRIAADGSIRNYTGDIQWDISNFALAPDERTVALTVNEGGLGVIRLLDLTTGVLRPGPALPPGIPSGLEFDSAGERLGFSFVAATSPTDAYAYDLASAELTRWTEAEVGGLDPTAFVAPELVQYARAEGVSLPAFVYTPKGPGPHPVIVSIHGGPEGQARPSFSSTYQYWLAELGVAVIVPNVRGSSGYGKSYVAADNGLNRKKSVADIGALLDWLARDQRFDADRVMVYGGSYGGYMVLASMIDYGEHIAGGIDVVGISDFKTFLTNTKGYRRDLRRAEYGDERDPEIAAFFERISPLRNAAKIKQPLFIVQGANDPRVPASESEQMLASVRANGSEAWYLLAKDEGHGFRKKANRDYLSAAQTLFISRVLGRERRTR